MKLKSVILLAIGLVLLLSNFTGCGDSGGVIVHEEMQESTEADIKELLNDGVEAFGKWWNEDSDERSLWQAVMGY